MAKKNKKIDGAIVGLAFIVVGIMTVYEWLGSALFWVVVLGGGALAAYYGMRKNPSEEITTSPKYNPPAVRQPPVTTRINTASASPADEYDNFIVTMKTYMDAGNWDAARQLLRSIAWGTHRTSTAEFKSQFKALVAGFAKRDPLFNRVVPEMTAHIQANPGCIQSQLTKLFTHVDIEDLRYVLYYAEALGLIVRVRKGNSYAIYLPDHAPQQLITEPISSDEWEFLQEMRAKKAVVLPFNNYWRQRLGEPERVLQKLANQGYFRRATLAESLAQQTKPRLVAMLKQQNLPVSGNKIELIQRLCDRAPDSAEALAIDLDVFIPT